MYYKKKKIRNSHRNERDRENFHNFHRWHAAADQSPEKFQDRAEEREGVAQRTKGRGPHRGSAHVRATQLSVRWRAAEEDTALQRPGQLDGERRAIRVRRQTMSGRQVHDHVEEVGSAGRGRDPVPRSFLAPRPPKARQTSESQTSIKSHWNHDLTRKPTDTTKTLKREKTPGVCWFFFFFMPSKIIDSRSFIIRLCD